MEINYLLKENEFIKNLLDMMNVFRNIHGVPPLSLDNSLGNAAKKVGQEFYEIGTVREFCNYNGDAEVTVERIEDTSFNGNWYAGKWYEHHTTYKYINQELNYENKKCVRMLMKLFSKVHIHVTPDSDFKLLVVYYGPKLTGPYITITNQILDVKLKIGFIDDETLKPLVLQIHNNIRERHGAPPLTWDDTLCGMAKKHIEGIINKTTRANEARGYGVNIWHNVEKVSMIEIIQKWYETYKEHKYTTTKPITAAAPFCQIVWKETELIGASYQKIKETHILVVVYVLPGNTPRKFSDNVKKPKSGNYMKPRYYLNIQSKNNII